MQGNEPRRWTSWLPWFFGGLTVSGMVALSVYDLATDVPPGQRRVETESRPLEIPTVPEAFSDKPPTAPVRSPAREMPEEHEPEMEVAARPSPPMQFERGGAPTPDIRRGLVGNAFRVRPSEPEPVDPAPAPTEPPKRVQVLKIGAAPVAAPTPSPTPEPPPPPPEPPPAPEPTATEEVADPADPAPAEDAGAPQE